MMNYQDRVNAIGEMLRDVLVRLQRPGYLDDATARAEIADMVEDLNREWPDIAGAEDFAKQAEAFRQALRKTHASRTWPSIAVMLKVLEASRKPSKNPSPEEVAEAIYGLVRDWWKQHGDAMPSTATATHADRLVAEGHATAGQLRRAGFPLHLGLREAAMAEPDPDHPALLELLQEQADRLHKQGGPRGRVTMGDFA